MAQTIVYRAKDKTEADIVVSYLHANGLHAVASPATIYTPRGGVFPTGGTTLHLQPWDIHINTNEQRSAQELLKHFKPQDRPPTPLPPSAKFLQIIVVAIVIFSVFALCGGVMLAIMQSSLFQ